MITIIDAIQSLIPNAEIIIKENNSIEWINPKNPDITEEEIQEEYLKLQTEYEKTEYQRLRQPEYPSLADLADAIYWQSKGDDSKMTLYLQACEDVKNQYPKPEDNNG